MIKQFTLVNNLSIPSVGLGTWHIKDYETIEYMIESSYNLGYRHIDTASKYQNEVFIGNAIKKLRIPRENIFLTSKLWNTDKGYDNTIKSFYKTLENLQTDYLDLYLIHWPMTAENWKELNVETWKAFEKLYLDGKIKAIGVSNFLTMHLKDLMSKVDIMPMVDQIEFHPGLPQKETVDFCRKNNIQVEAWSPLGSGNILNNSYLKEISKKYNKSIAQICIRWCLENNVIPLPKSTNIERLRENINVDDFNIEQEDMDNINNMDCIYYSGLNPNIIFP
mgnify:CR=1 FL=1